MNTSASGGYLSPTTTPLPGGLTLNQFIQTVLVGISGLTNTLVRPKWQQQPAKQPEINVDWLAFSFTSVPKDAYGATTIDAQGNTHFQRQEYVEIQCSFYGPNCSDNASLVLDGFQIQQNLAALKAAKMGFIENGTPIRSPELTNERWVDRCEVSIKLVRLVQRTYPILSFTSASGTTYTDISTDHNFTWNVEGAP